MPSLIHPAETGQRVALSTAYRSLQTQLLTELAALPAYSQLPIRYQVLKGASNYLRIRRLQELVHGQSTTSPQRDRLALAYLVEWSEAGGSDLDETSDWADSSRPTDLPPKQRFRRLRASGGRRGLLIALRAASSGDEPARAFKVAPIYAGTVLEPLFSTLDAAVFPSATLTIRGGDFTFVAERLGLGERLAPGSTLVVPGGLDYGQNAFLGLTNYLRGIPLEGESERFRQDVAQELNLLCSCQAGSARGREFSS